MKTETSFKMEMQSLNTLIEETMEYLTHLENMEKLQQGKLEFMLKLKDNYEKGIGD